jgi:hypothetical protein
MVQSPVGLAIAAVIEVVAATLARGDWDRAGAAERGKCRLAAQPLGVLAGGEQELAGVAGADPSRPVVLRAALATRGVSCTSSSTISSSRRAIRLARLRSASLKKVVR